MARVRPTYQRRFRSSLYASGLLALFELTAQEFTRAQVFALLRNPLVQKAHGFSAEQESIWESWAKDLHVFRGIDRESRRTLGDFEPSGQHTWSRAIERLLAGSVALRPVLLDPHHALEPEEWIVPWSDMDSTDPDVLLGFVKVLESMASEMKALASAELRTWGEWADCVQGLLDRWLVIGQERDLPRSMSAERAVRSSVLATLESLRVFTYKVNWSQFRMVLASRIDTELPARSSVLGGKLMVCTMREARPLPWKHAFVLGMQAGDFPPREREDRLDLRWWKPIPGDSNPRRSMQYAFLELLTSVRQSLTLSYQCESLSNGTPILPSSTLLELERFLQQSLPGWSRESVSFLAEEDPAPKVLLPVIQALRNARDAKNQNVEETLRSIVRIGEASSGLDFAGFKSMLANPLEYTLRRTLKLRDEEGQDGSADVDLPLFWNTLEAWQIRHSWLHAMANALFADGVVPDLSVVEVNSLAKRIWVETFESFVAQGKSPEKILGDFAEGKERKSLENLVSQWQELVQTYRGCEVQNNYAEPPLAGLLEGNSASFRRIQKGAHEVVLLLLPSALKARSILDGYVLALWRAVHGKQKTVLHVISQDGAESKKLATQWTLEVDAARAILQELVQSSRNGEKALEMLPIEAAEHLKSWTEMDVTDWIREELEKSNFATYRLPLEIMRTLDWKVPEDAEYRYRVRVLPLFKPDGKEKQDD